MRATSRSKKTPNMSLSLKERMMQQRRQQAQKNRTSNSGSGGGTGGRRENSFSSAFKAARMAENHSMHSLAVLHDNVM